MSHQETVSPDPQQAQQQTDELETQAPDPEVVPTAKRRQFSAKYKLRILEEIDNCTESGQIGELLRREGLYSSYLSGKFAAPDSVAIGQTSFLASTDPETLVSDIYAGLVSFVKIPKG